MYTAGGVEYVPAEFAGTIAESLITALQLARPIVANEGDDTGRSQLSTWVQSVVAGQIDECLKAAQTAFPDAESFQTPQPPSG